MKKQFVLASTLILGMSVTLPSVSSAQSTQQGMMDQDFQNKILDEETIKTVDKYIIVKNNQFKLTNSKELKKEISKSDLHKVKEQLQEVNDMVSKYDSITTVNKDTIQVEITDEEIKEKLEESGYDMDQINNSNDSFSNLKQTDIFQISATSNGVNKVKWHWWGAEIWLSKATVNNVINAGIGAGSTALGLLLPGVGAAVIVAINAYIGGIYAGKYARACKFDYSWVNGPKNFEYQ